uniref:Uncharacterized protein n=1 Tax=Brassica oleracea var. oleracea TaxID=109376 RepID=A0A0D3AAD0_BRAOL
MLKSLNDVSQIHKKITSTHAPVAEPSLFICEIQSLILCEDECDFPSLKSDFMFDDEETYGLTCFEPEHPSSLVLVSQDFEEKPFDYPHQGPFLGIRIPLDDDPGSIFDEEDELGPIFDEEAPRKTSINMEKHLCFDPDTTPTPLTIYIQEHCEKLDLINSLPEIHDLITGDLFASTCALDEFTLRKLLEHKSLTAETEFVHESVLKPAVLK